STPLGQRAPTNFANPQGLQPVGDNAWAETHGSGLARRGAAGTAEFGMIQGGALEASNVNLTGQLVNMITAQRNFQANAQMIQAQDALTQTVIDIRCPMARRRLWPPAAREAPPRHGGRSGTGQAPTAAAPPPHRGPQGQGAPH